MKEKLIWKKEYEIGVYEIDSEHQIFLKIIQKIDKAFQEKYEKEYTLLLLNELYKYADFHFISEENIMRFNKYPELNSHQEEHKKLLAKLSEKIGFFDIEFLNQKKLVKFLFEWFLGHTTTLDLKFGVFLKK